MNISLPDPLKSFVEEQIESGRYSSVSEYVRELIREDEKRRAQQQLEQLLLEGIHSGDALPLSRRDWDDIRRTVRERIKSKKTT